MSELTEQRGNVKRMRGSFRCNVCHQHGTDLSTLYTTIYALKRHVFATHLHEKGFTLTCGIDGCPIELQNRRNLSDHVTKKHPGCEWVPSFRYDDRHAERINNPENTGSSSEVYIEEGVSGVSVSTNPVLVHHYTDTPQESHRQAVDVVELIPPVETIAMTDVEINDEEINTFIQNVALDNEQRQLNTALSLAQLKADFNISQVAMKSVQQWIEGLLENVSKTLIGGFKLINATEVNGSVTSLNDVFDLGEGLANPFHGLDSEWMLKKILKDKLGYVEPETVVLHETMNAGVGGKTEIHTMQYVPILDVLKLLYRDKKFRSELEKRKPSTDGVMTDFFDGIYFKNHPLFTQNKNALQLQLYYDGFEVVNPLGSKIQKHNIGALYFSILNLDPSYRSTLKSICLAALVFDKDVKHPDIGWEVILRRFNADLKKLEHGVNFSVDGEEVFVQGTIAQWALDNKAAHSLFGLQECFFGEGLCISRYCHCTTADIQDKAMSNECVARDRASFDRDQQTVEETGQPANSIKSKCYIESQFFHRADAFAADIHHDILEGLIPGMLKPILQALTKKRLFTMKLLNSRVVNFDYNVQDAKNRPSPITEVKLRDDTRSLKQYAAQYWCLLRKLPLIIGDRIPPEDEHWCLLLQLLDVVDLIMSPKVDEQTLAYLEMQLLLLFKEFRRYFPGVRITPKMHYTLHYPNLMRQVGPLIRHWVMRFEAKHHFFKRAAVLSGNFINVSKTLAVRHQMLQVVHVTQGGLLGKDVVVTDGYPGDINNLQLGEEASVLLGASKVTICSKVTIHGTVYSEGTAILTGFDADGIVEVGEIRQIVLSSSRDVCFIVALLKVTEFDEHFHAWKVERPRNPSVAAFLYSALPDYQPVGVHYSFDNNSGLYASFRYHVLNSTK